MASQSSSSSDTKRSWFPFKRKSNKSSKDDRRASDTNDNSEDHEERPTKWGMGVLNDRYTNEVPGSVIFCESGDRNQPLGLENAPARTSASSLPQPRNSADFRRSSRRDEGRKTTPDGIILNPQPDDSANDPLNWPAWRRNCALLSLSLYCMMGGGMTTVLAAGFSNVSATFNVPVPRVALTTGFYMMGLGLGSVVMSPTAILFGKRPVYLFCAIMFVITSIWCAFSPNYPSLVVARIFQGISVSSVECLPSATIAEIFFLHERAYRIGVYTLLLLGGKNLIPLASAAIIQSLSWRWVFGIVAMVVAFCGTLLFVFVPESFWDRSPRPKSAKPRNTSRHSAFSIKRQSRPTSRRETQQVEAISAKKLSSDSSLDNTTSALPNEAADYSTTSVHVGFAGDASRDLEKGDPSLVQHPSGSSREHAEQNIPTDLHNLNSPSHEMNEKEDADYFSNTQASEPQSSNNNAEPTTVKEKDPAPRRRISTEGIPTVPTLEGSRTSRYTNDLRHSPPRTFIQQLKPFHGRLTHDNWFRVAARPFILFSYPGVLWSALIYACSVGWLIVLSESVTQIFRTNNTYKFGALHAGLLYLSPFIGGILGTAVAGKVSDFIVRAMTRRNGGLYEPEFRLVMAIPVAITTVIGLMGFGWSAQIADSWIVPTFFFGVISFGCCLGSTTAITFCVDSYRQYAGEALVTLNFAKNIFHGLVFSLFFTDWLQSDGSKMVFIWIGVIQLITLTTTVPMYIFGKRARMWTVRKNFMEKF